MNQTTSNTHDVLLSVACSTGDEHGVKNTVDVPHYVRLCHLIRGVVWSGFEVKGLKIGYLIRNSGKGLK